MPEPMPPPARPVSGTYRLQLHAGFGFAAAQALVPYLADLGVSTVYISPVLQAAPGSMHGYDVVDHTAVSTELGGREGLERLAAAAHGAGLGVLVDVVPNHMAFPAQAWRNAPLWDLLRYGRGSAYAHWFDVDWEAGDGRIGLPVLGAPLTEVLAGGELVLDERAGEAVVRYHDRVLPVAPGTEGADVAAVVAAQHWQLASWRDKATALTYRRFFDVDELIAVRVELDQVFDATHALLLDLYERGVLDGFRIDHPDGMADPEGYVERLSAAAPGAWLLVEKILARQEQLPTGWPVHGTTGYDAIRALQTALVPPVGDHLTRVWADLGGAGVEQVEAQAMRDAVTRLLGPEVARLTRVAVQAAAESDARLEPDRAEAALVELLVAAEVYRAYLRPGHPAPVESLDRLAHTVEVAGTRRPDLGDELTVLHRLLADTGVAGHTARPATADLLVRFQQTCGPALAKGIEDTAFYRMHRLCALAEVGGDLDAFVRGGASVLHEWASRQARDWPYGMTTLSTHDTKRSEDVRARLLAMAEDTPRWDGTWALVRHAAEGPGVDLRDAYLLMQTVLGAWPIDSERLDPYLTKALREGKARTTWTEPDEAYERRVLDLGHQVLAPGRLRDSVAAHVDALAAATRSVTLSAKLLQLTLPGVPDVYQGCELVERSLVDPDNRRPVDFAARQARLDRLPAGAPVGDVADAPLGDAVGDAASVARGGGESGRAGGDRLDDEKLAVTTTALRLRRSGHVAGSYEPFDAGNQHLLAFVRGGRALSVATRWPTTLASRGGWGDATLHLPPGTWTDALSGATVTGAVPVADLLAELPVALLLRAATAT